MSTFSLDAEGMLDTIAAALEEAGSEASEEQFTNIANAIDDRFPGVIEILTYGMQEHWKAEAVNSGGWGNKYAAAIKARVTGDTGEVYLDETMIDKASNKPNMMFVKMVEEGMKSWSIKDALLKSEKAKTSSEGIKYIVVPFPVAAPRKKSSGKMASKFGGREMTQEMYNIVKSGGKVSGKLKSGGSVSGLTQYVTRQKHSQFGMFLCVSEKSSGWIHPGVAPSPVFQSVEKEVDKRINEVVNAFCRAIVREYTT